jgi:hypothetical protein
VLPATNAWAVNTSRLYLNSASGSYYIPIECHYGTSGTVGSAPELSLKNNCSVRMWLHENENGTGMALCVRANSRAVLRRHYAQWQVSSNPASC